MFWKNQGLKENEIKTFEIRESRAAVFIEASPEKVWECISDVRNYDKWVKWFKTKVPDHIERIEKAGDYTDYETTILGIPFRGRTVTVERIPPQRSAFFLISAYRGGGEFLLKPEGRGTRVHYTLWTELPESYLGKAVDKVLLANQGLEKMNDHLNRLKAYVEEVPLP